MLVERHVSLREVRENELLGAGVAREYGGLSRGHVHVFVCLLCFCFEVCRFAQDDIDAFGEFDGVFAWSRIHDMGIALPMSHDAHIGERYLSAVVKHELAMFLEVADRRAQAQAKFGEFLGQNRMRLGFFDSVALALDAMIEGSARNDELFASIEFDEGVG